VAFGEVAVRQPPRGKRYAPRFLPAMAGFASYVTPAVNSARTRSTILCPTQQAALTSRLMQPPSVGHVISSRPNVSVPTSNGAQANAPGRMILRAWSRVHHPRSQYGGVSNAAARSVSPARQRQSLCEPSNARISDRSTRQALNHPQEWPPWCGTYSEGHAGTRQLQLLSRASRPQCPNTNTRSMKHGPSQGDMPRQEITPAHSQTRRPIVSQSRRQQDNQRAR
jgi:hypothetical protein